ncbi:MAG: AAA family ATPase [Deltaproteobacteria bacterium]|nr:AAA family ATPase [Deltaproteobacteria bacterium]
MYESFYGLKEKPFNILPDPEYLFMSTEHDNAYTHMLYAIKEKKGFVVITGEIGSGKTTLINYLLEQIQEEINVGLINNTFLPPTQFVKMICQEFELEVDGMDKAAMMAYFQDFLLQQYTQKKRVVLIIDEAQNLSRKTMEEIRMLSNIEAEKHHLIQMVFVGQPELKYKLQQKSLEQFAQRVTVHCHLDVLKTEEVEKYVKHRMKVGGAQDQNIFDKEAIAAISLHSRGIPRIINTLCDTALVYGFADGLKNIGKKTIQDVIKSRAEGGIFSEISKDEKKEDYATIKKNPFESQYLDRMKLMEEKIHNIDNLLVNLDKRLLSLTDKKEDRDIVVVELFKLLKKSMEDRFDTQMKFCDYLKEEQPDDHKELELNSPKKFYKFTKLFEKEKN